MKSTILCPTCSGTGQAPLPPALQETLDVLPRRGKFTADDVHPKLPAIIGTAVNNRLRHLLQLGILTRERAGKFWLYQRA